MIIYFIAKKREKQTVVETTDMLNGPKNITFNDKMKAVKSIIKSLKNKREANYFGEYHLMGDGSEHVNAKIANIY